jgi:hypothetical protein
MAALSLSRKAHGLGGPKESIELVTAHQPPTSGLDRSQPPARDPVPDARDGCPTFAGNFIEEQKLAAILWHGVQPPYD